MKRRYRQVLERSTSDHTIATVTKYVLGAVGVLAGLVMIRSIPDLVRYVKIERM